MPEQYLSRTSSAQPGSILWKFLISLSRALDLSYNGIMSHHMRVAVIIDKISRAMGLSQDITARTVQASLIHDLGVKTWGDRNMLQKFEVADPYTHALEGCRILTDGGDRMASRSSNDRGGGALFGSHAVVILHHHDKWDGGNPTGAKRNAIPIEARMIHLADRIDVLLDESRPFNSQRQEILKIIQSQRGRVFDPELIEVVSDLSKSESFWFDLEQSFLPKSLESNANRDLAGALPFGLVSLDGLGPSLLDVVEALSWVFAEVVDRRSPYTQRHCRMVGDCSYTVAKNLGLSDSVCRELRVAGLLHDLGKLGVSEDILNKEGPLDDEELYMIKRHPYLTYHLLSDIPGFDRIKEWASFHHERPDGQGYPFRMDSSELSLESRIVAVCDVFSALYENRPYRPGLSPEEVKRILVEMAQEGALDREVVDVAVEVLWEVTDLGGVSDLGEVSDLVASTSVNGS